MKPLILIDGSNWLYRAYFGLSQANLRNAQGEPTGMVLGFANMIRKLLKDYAPERIGVVFDPPGETFRNTLYAEYKATRDETPEDLSSQFPHVKDWIAYMGLPTVTLPNEEADDVIGSLVSQARERGIPVLIVTGDKDMAQLVDERVQLLDTMKSRTLGPAEVKEKFGVMPAQITEYLALIGDTSDNIPGVKGVGPKTAVKLLEEFGSLDALLQRAGEVKGKVGENLREALPTIPLARQLVTIRCELSMPVALDDLKPAQPDKARLAEFYRRMGFNRLLDEINAVPSNAATGDAPATTPAPVALPTEGLRTRAEIVLDEAALDAMIARLKGAALVAFDTETDALDSMRAHLVGLSFAIEPGHGWYVPLDHRYLGAPQQLPAERVLSRVKPLLEDPQLPKVGQHMKYDLNVLKRFGIEVQGIAFDTMLQSYVLDAAGWRHDMDSMAAQHLGHKTTTFQDVAGKGKSQVSFNQVPVEQAAAYAAEDADITLRLHQALFPRVSEVPALLKVFETVEMPLVPVLARIEQNGVYVDGKLLQRISHELGERMAQLTADAYREAGGEFNLGSPLQLQQILYDRLKLPVLAKTPKGQPSTAEDVLEQLAEQHALPRKILDWRALSKLRSTYTESLPLAINPKTGRIHTSYGQAVAATGRLSSNDPNLQNIPVRTAEGRRIRQAFVPQAPGHSLLSIDYSQIELRLMAHLSGDARLTAAFNSGHDIHKATAAEVFGVPLEQVTSDQRRAVKAINFGLIYGMSAFGLAKQLSVPRAEAQTYMDTFFARYLGVKAYMDNTREQARAKGYVETLLGRRLYLPDIRSKNGAQRQYAERTAINAPLQGTAADLIKLAMIDLDRFIRDGRHPVSMIMQVHDELVFEGPTQPLQALAPQLAQRMCRIFKLSVPLAADYGIGANWDDAHSGKGSATSG
ncbi:MAG TPA: DNA polymerase I [Verrucomicrobiae bacterium]|nr:DNA polymerase I [Verrucomicrobiae bacterium]